MSESLRTAASWIQERIPTPPLVGVILGSGLGEFAERLEDAVVFSYGDIPGFPASSVVGHAGKLVVGKTGGVWTAVLAGRVHFYEGHPMSSVVFPARVLGLLGCHTVIVTNAAGGVDKSFRAGDLMLITDHLNFFGTNPLVGANHDDLGPRFPDMSEAYKKDLIAIARQVARKAKIPVREGVYAGLHGPSYETPAEIRMLRTLGANAVGMSTVPEVIALNQMGVGVVGISCITNMAAGVLPRKLDHAEVLETTIRVKDRIVALLSGLAAAVGNRQEETPRPHRKPAPKKKAVAKKAPAKKTGKRR